MSGELGNNGGRNAGNRGEHAKDRRPTRDDVARLAGVSAATVSNVLNHRAVSDKLSEKVHKAMEQLEYIPNQAARSLMTRTSRQIGFVMVNMRSAQLLDLLQGAQYESTRQGYTLTIALYDQGKIEDILNDYMQRGIEGIICEAQTRISADTLRRLSAVGIPLVRLGPSAPGGVGLWPDYYGGMVKAYTGLRALGHRHIAHVSGFSEKHIDGRFQDERLAAYADCREQDGGFDPEWVVYGEYPYQPNEDSGYQMTVALLRRRIPFTAIIASADSVALGVLQALREANLSVPSDVSLVSFNNTHLATATYPTLTSMAPPSFRMGCDTVREILTARGREWLPPAHEEAFILRQGSEENGTIIRYPMEWVARKSTGPVHLHEGYETRFWK